MNSKNLDKFLDEVEHKPCSKQGCNYPWIVALLIRTSDAGTKVVGFCPGHLHTAASVVSGVQDKLIEQQLFDQDRESNN